MNPHKMMATKDEQDIMKILLAEHPDWEYTRILRRARKLIEAEADWVPRMIKVHKGAKR